MPRPTAEARASPAFCSWRYHLQTSSITHLSSDTQPCRHEYNLIGSQYPHRHNAFVRDQSWSVLPRIPSLPPRKPVRHTAQPDEERVSGETCLHGSMAQVKYSVIHCQAARTT